MNPTDQPPSFTDLYCLATFHDFNVVVTACDEIPDPQMAEVWIPYQGKLGSYVIVCYITNKMNSEPAILEMFMLNEQAEHLVEILTLRKEVAEQIEQILKDQGL